MFVLPPTCRSVSTCKLPFTILVAELSDNVALRERSSVSLIESSRPSSSAMAFETVEAVVPIAPAVIVPSSASCSLMAAIADMVVAVVNALWSPNSVRSSLTAADTSVALNPVKLMLPKSVSCSLIACLKVCAVVFKLPRPITPIESYSSLTAAVTPPAVVLRVLTSPTESNS